ncbi:hypothetical protein OROMI_026231 [Orobanche minor]
MDSSEAEKVVMGRISRSEPEHIAKKITGYIYFQGISDQEMIRLALGLDTLIDNLIQKAKKTHLLTSAPPVLSPPILPTVNPFSPISPLRFSVQAPPSFRRMDPHCGPQLDPPPALPMHNPSFKMLPYSDFIGSDDSLLETVEAGSFNPPNDYYCPEVRQTISQPNGFSCQDLSLFQQRFCKHGSNCRYLHGELFHESCYPQLFGPNASEVGGDDHVFSPRSLEKLELEITELLKSRRGHPVSIASLPMMYYEKYGRTLEAEGYLTESQRHGKAGYSLTKLLARMKNCIRLIDRPHGQHAVILADDAPKYMDIRGKRNDPGPIVSGSRQIYLTFPSESTSTEEDVSSYFRYLWTGTGCKDSVPAETDVWFHNFCECGHVKIFCPKLIHIIYVVLVSLSNHIEKNQSSLKGMKYLEKFEHPLYYHSHPTDVDLENQTDWESSRLFRRQLMEENENVMKLEMMRLSQIQLDHLKFPSAERFNSLLDALNSGSASYDNPKFPANSCGDQKSVQGLNLLDSAVASSVAAVI